MQKIVIKNSDSNDDIEKNVNEEVQKIWKRITPNKRQRSPDQSDASDDEVEYDKERKNSKKNNTDDIQELKHQLEELLEQKDKYRDKLLLMADQMSVLEHILENGTSAPVPKVSIDENVKILMENGIKVVRFGPYNTTIEYRLYETINWLNVSSATRSLLDYVFDSHTLATHSMTGRPSNAVKTTTVKEKLNPEKLEDIIYLVCLKSSADAKIVRNCITTKCADENKSLKRRLKDKCDKHEVKDESKSEENDTDSQSID